MKYDYEWYLNNINEANDKNGYLYINQVPKKYRTYEMCLKSLNLKSLKRYSEFEGIPKKYLTKNFIQLAINANCIYVFEHIDLTKYDEDFILTAIKKNGEFLYGIPKKYLTSEIVYYAVKNSKISITNIPEKFRTPKIISMCIKNDAYNIRFSKNYTYEDAIVAVRQDPTIIEFIKRKFYSEELFLHLLRDETCYGWLPEKYKTSDFHNKLTILYPKNKYYKELAKSYNNKEKIIEKYDCLWYKNNVTFPIPFKYRTYDLIVNMVKTSNKFDNSRGILNNIPKSFFTDELLELAMDTHIPILKYYNTKELSRETILKSLASNVLNIRYIHKDILQQEIVDYAVNINTMYDIFNYIPKKFITPYVISKCITREPNIMEYVKYTYGDALEAIKHISYYFYLVNKKYHTEEMFLHALHEEVYYGWLPDKFKTLDFHTKLIKQYPENDFYKNIYRKYFLNIL